MIMDLFPARPEKKIKAQDSEDLKLGSCRAKSV